jgi:hypothetical protein
MIRKFALAVLLVAGIACSAPAQQRFAMPSAIGSAPTRQVNGPGYNETFSGPGAYQPSSANEAYAQPYEPISNYSPASWVQEAEKASGGEAGAAGGGGGGQAAGAAAANNPGVPLSQFQFQNVFVPESYGSTGYANQFIVQPVIAINLNPDNYFQYHIVRATLPVLAPLPDPDGIVPDRGGLGDTTYFDLYFPKSKKEGVKFGYGPVAILPTSTSPSLIHGDRQTGLGEWQLGPAAAYINSSKKGWVFGALVEIPFSLESDAYAVECQPILTKLLKDEKYIAIGDLLWKFDDQNGNYNIPLSMKFGKVIKAGKQPINVFLQPEYTPVGLTSHGTQSKYGLKISVSFLLPGAEFGYNKEKAAKKACGSSCLGCCHCN